MGTQPVSEGLTGPPWCWEPATCPSEGPGTHNFMELPDPTATPSPKSHRAPHPGKRHASETRESNKPRDSSKKPTGPNSRPRTLRRWERSRSWAGPAARAGAGGQRGRVRARRHTLEPCLQREGGNSRSPRSWSPSSAWGPYLSQPIQGICPVFSHPSPPLRVGVCTRVYQPAHSGWSARGERGLRQTLPWDLEGHHPPPAMAPRASSLGWRRGEHPRTEHILVFILPLRSRRFIIK